MAEVTITTGTESEPEIDGSEIVEAIEEQSTDAVQIAQIKADRDITLAAIHAENEQARIAAETKSRAAEIEARANEEDDEWQRAQIQNLTEQVQTMATQLSTLQALLAPPVEVATISTPQYTPEETSSTPMEVIDVSEVESPAEAPPPAPRRKIRRI